MFLKITSFPHDYTKCSIKFKHFKLIHESMKPSLFLIVKMTFSKEKIDFHE